MRRRGLEFLNAKLDFEVFRHVNIMLEKDIGRITRGGEEVDELWREISQVGFNVSLAEMVLVGKTTREDCPVTCIRVSGDAVGLGDVIEKGAWGVRGASGADIISVLGDLKPGFNVDVREGVDEVGREITGFDFDEDPQMVGVFSTHLSVDVS